MKSLWVLAVCCGSLAGCHQKPVPVRQEVWRPPSEPAPSTSAAATVSAEPVEETRVFDPAIVQLEKSSVVAQVRRALAEDKTDQARSLAETAVPRAGASEKGQLHWLAASAALAQGDTARALAHLTTLSHLGHPLARWAQLRRAAQLETTEPLQAVALAAPLTDSWAGQRRARLIEARALIRLERNDEAIARLRVAVKETSEIYGAASAGMPLARLLEQKGDLASKEEALALYRRVISRAPLTQVGRQAQLRHDALLATMPQTAKADRVRAPIRRELAKAEGHYAQKRYRQAERAYARALKGLDEGSAAWCEARYKQARSLLHRRERSRGAPMMARMADRCPAYDMRPWARYHSARGYGRIGRWDAAIAQYETLQAESGSHRLADDALFRAALAEIERGKVEAGLARLASVPTRYPEGDMWPEALFRLGWIALRQGRYGDAFERFDALVERGGDAPEEGVTGRAEYWRARSLFLIGRRLDAVEQYAEIVRRWPLRYYAQQSLARLSELVPERAEAIVQRMREPEQTRVVFAWREEFDEPGFKRAIELLSVGEITFASAEMYDLDMLGEDLDPELAVVGAILLQSAGARVRLDRAIREHFEEFEGLLPKGEGRLIWDVAYPQAFSPLIESAAKRESLPPAFVRAVAREESSFDANAVSWAKAYGLVQIILPTAKRFASEVGVRATPRTLKNPKINLRIGTRYMAWLWARFSENPALVPASYNAGENAVRRWLAEDSARPLDVFIEEIPFDETRRYTRRVLQTYGVYQGLDDEQLPELRQALPQPRTQQRFSSLR